MKKLIAREDYSCYLCNKDIKRNTLHIRHFGFNKDAMLNNNRAHVNCEQVKRVDSVAQIK